MKTYIDVTNLVNVQFVTGIQRVVMEIVTRFLKDSSLDVEIFSWPASKEEMTLLRHEDFLSCYEKHSLGRACIGETAKMNIDEIKPGDLFFDIDAVWNPSNHNRCEVYKKLKEKSVKIATYVYDLIPLKYPNYAHEITLFNFMKYAYSVVSYSDYVFCSTKAVEDDIHLFCDKIGRPRLDTKVTWLGSNFNSKQTLFDSVSEEARNVAAQGKYILMVGTIEPRKNHALLLDAYDEKLSKLGMNIVFVGRQGWNVDDLMKRIEEHPSNGNGIFHLKGQSDASVDFLYKNAFAVAFPTFDEGFGLPMVEAFQRGAVVFASDVKVMREVGGDYADYFDPKSADSFASLVESYLNNPELYEKAKKRISEYKPVSWDDVSNVMSEKISSIDSAKTLEIPQTIEQMVILSARIKNLFDTLPFIEKYMPFIKRVLVCCPDSMKKDVESSYKGNIEISALSDSEVLAGMPLPDDHLTRNFFLRCCAMKSPAIDDVFIMSDDDYRPLRNVPCETFVQDGKYNAFYCYELENWPGTPWNMTSFDIGMRNSLAFCRKNGYTSKMYASHCPQVIDKRIFLKMLEAHPGIEMSGISEWESYFNYAISNYPAMFENKKYMTLTWPGNFTDWKRQFEPDDFLFENFYEESYAQGGVFAGFTPSLTACTDIENEKKISVYKKVQFKYANFQHNFELFEKVYLEKTSQTFDFAVFLKKDSSLYLATPSFLVCEQNAFFYFALHIDSECTSHEELTVESFFADKNGQKISDNFYSDQIPLHGEKSVLLPFKSMGFCGNFTFCFSVTVGSKKLTKVIPISVITPFETLASDSDKSVAYKMQFSLSDIRADADANFLMTIENQNVLESVEKSIQQLSENKLSDYQLCSNAIADIADGVDIENFYEAEEWGRWAVAPECSVTFRGNQISKAGKHAKLCFEASAFHSPRTVKISLNGFVLSDLEISASYEVHEIILPLDKISQVENKIVFTGLGDFKSPKELGLNADERNLFIAFRKIYIENPLFERTEKQEERLSEQVDRLSIADESISAAAVAISAQSDLLAKQGELIERLYRENADLKKLVMFTKNHTLWGVCARIYHKIGKIIRRR